MDLGATWTVLSASAPFSPRFRAGFFVRDQTMHMLLGLHAQDWWQSGDQGLSWSLVASSVPALAVAATRGEEFAALEFDGVGGYAATAAPNNLLGATASTQIQSTLTVAVWLFPTALEAPPSTQWRALLGVQGGFALYWSGAQGAFVFAIDPGSGSQAALTAPIAAPSALLGRWSHHVVTYSASAGAVWRIDGAIVGQSSAGSYPTMATTAPRAAPLMLGIDGTQTGTVPSGAGLAFTSNWSIAGVADTQPGSLATFITMPFAPLANLPPGSLASGVKAVIAPPAVPLNDELYIFTYRPDPANSDRLLLQGSYMFKLEASQFTGGGSTPQEFTIPVAARWPVQSGDYWGFSGRVHEPYTSNIVTGNDGSSPIHVWQSLRDRPVTAVEYLSVRTYDYFRDYAIQLRTENPPPQNFFFQGKMRALQLWSSELSEEDAMLAATAAPGTVSNTTRVAYYPLSENSGLQASETVANNSLMLSHFGSSSSLPHWLQLEAAGTASTLHQSPARAGFSVMLFDRGMTLWAGEDSQQSVEYTWPRTHAVSSSAARCDGGSLRITERRGSQGGCAGLLRPGAECSLACNAGFILRGRPYRCAADGHWEGHQDCVSLADGFVQLQAGAALLPSFPSNRRYASLVSLAASFSPVRPAAFYLFSGELSSGDIASDVLVSRDAASWSALGSAPAWSPRLSPAVSDAARARIWALGGFNLAGTAFNDVVSFDGQGWSEPRAVANLPPLAGHSLLALPATASPLFDAALGGLLAIGGDMKSIDSNVYL